MDLISDLEARGLIHDSTDREFLRSRLAEGPIGVYVGFVVQYCWPRNGGAL